MQVTDMDAVDEDIKMPAQDAICIHQVEFYGGILLDDVFDQFASRRSREGKLALIVNVILHHGGKTDSWHTGIVIQDAGKQAYDNWYTGKRTHG